MSPKQFRISRAVRSRLNEARIARLATVDSAGNPHAVPVCFVYDGNFLYSAIDQKPKRVAPQRLTRVRNILERPRVALLIDEYREDWTRLWFILIRGKANLMPISARRERNRAFSKLKRKYPQYERGMLAENALIIRIAVERITIWGHFPSSQRR